MSSTLITAFVIALAQVETPHGVPVQPGPAGETGRWQLTAAVRRDRGAEIVARKEEVTDEAIATAHVLWLQDQLLRNGRAPILFNVALAWNCGLEQTLRGQAPVRSFDFARRVLTVTVEIQNDRWAKQLAAAAGSSASPKKESP
ncbi:MAG TPA: hypothetical protein VG734_20760 [Lacunisphaera sp.]|nr:hypothetical protein [Lacunisphaera sp.]